MSLNKMRIGFKFKNFLKIKLQDYLWNVRLAKVEI